MDVSHRFSQGLACRIATAAIDLWKTPAEGVLPLTGVKTLFNPASDGDLAVNEPCGPGILGLGSRLLPAAAGHLTRQRWCGELVDDRRHCCHLLMDPSPALLAATAVTAALPAAEQAEIGVVSLRAEVPEALLHSMRAFIDAHPNWDQYRLFQAALAGFLVQNGVQSRSVTRCYVTNMFRRGGEPGPFSVC
jgi:hypothetical protein